MPKFYLDTEEKGKGYIVGWMGRLQKTRDGQNNRKGAPAGSWAGGPEGDDFSFAANGAVVQPSILQVQKPSDRLGDFTVVRASDATYVDSSGVIQTAPDNVARIDWTNGVGELLTEQQSTNLITYSEDFSQWAGNNVVIEIDNEISPDGTQNADKIYDDDTDGLHRIILNNIPAPTDTDYTFVTYMKKGTMTTANMRFYDNTTSITNCNFDLELGTATSGVITDVGNGWWKCQINGRSLLSGLIAVNIYLGSSGTYVGNGDYLYLWGAQLEALPYATSYIKTSGSTVTRLQDGEFDAGNVNVINSEEGTFMVLNSVLFDTLTDRVISISDGTLNNQIKLTYTSVSNQIAAECIVGGVSQALLTHTLADSTLINNIIFRYAINDFSLWIGAAKVDESLLGSVPPIATLFKINYGDGLNNNKHFGRNRENKLYDRYLTDEEIINLQS